MAAAKAAPDYEYSVRLQELAKNARKAIQDAETGLLSSRLDLALGFARLASYLFQIGNRGEARVQCVIAQYHYRAVVKDGEALNLDAAAGQAQREKRRAIEDLLHRLLQAI